MFDQIDENHDGMIDALEMKRILKTGVNKLLKMTSKKNFLPRVESMQEKNTRLVALVAHNHMKAPLLHFVTKHIDFFKTVNIVTTGSTGSVLEKNLGLKIKHTVQSTKIDHSRSAGQGGPGSLRNDSRRVPGHPGPLRGALARSRGLARVAPVPTRPMQLQ